MMRMLIPSMTLSLVFVSVAVFPQDPLPREIAGFDLGASFTDLQEHAVADGRRWNEEEHFGNPSINGLHGYDILPRISRDAPHLADYVTVRTLGRDGESVLLSFSDEILFHIRRNVSVDPDNEVYPSRVVDLLIARYGRPDIDQVQERRAPSGFLITKRTVVWQDQSIVMWATYEGRLVFESVGWDWDNFVPVQYADISVLQELSQRALGYSDEQSRRANESFNPEL